MTSEVNDIHPMLNQLFSKMEIIERIEYKQGSQENGADFVLIKRDESWSIEEYVGVIVKKDSITKNSTDVMRQIDECINTPRTVNGKKSIALDEVWVITISNVSISAQEFFSSKYKSAKIKFIDGEKLARIVNKHIPDYFRNIPHEINNYLLRAKENITLAEKNSQFSFQRNAGINIEQELIPNENKKYKHKNRLPNKPSNRTTIWKILDKKSVSLIEGSMGSGKSSLLRKTALELLDIESYIETKRIPIYITFKDFEEKHIFNIKNLLEVEIGQGIQPENNIILLIDGLDETMHDIDKRLTIIDEIIKQADAVENIRLIMTIRELDSDELKTKITRPFRSYRMAPVSLKQVISVIENCCKGANIKNRMIEDLKKSSIYKSLPKTPIAVILLAKLINENPNDIPSNLTELYSKFTELSLGRWDISKGLINEKEYSALDNITQKIAKYLVTNNLTKISLDEAKGFFEIHLRERNLGIDHNKLFESAIERSEIFYSDTRNGIFGFKHRTFSEFFYAKSLNSKPTKTISEIDLEFYWAAINFFWVGLKKDCPEILDEFSELSASNDKYQLLKIINLSNILLAGYQSPYESIKNGIEKIFVETAQLYINICKGKTDSKLRNFSEMNLLAIFRWIMSDAYGYEFFSGAIDEAIINIAERKDIDNDVMITAIFLLNTSQVKPIIENLFSSIASNDLLRNAPMAVQLAIKHESIDQNILNAHIKKIDKNIKRTISNRSMQEKIRSMYELPLGKLLIKSQKKG